MIRIGVISPADIAFRRFMPAILSNDNFEYVGLAIYNREERFRDEEVSADEQEKTIIKEQEKGKRFVDTFGGKLFDSYQSLLKSKEIDAVYVPLPPALHYTYGKKALEQGKHLLIEKPATISSQQSEELIYIAARNKLAVCENYMFVFHRQIEQIQRLILNGTIGEVRLFSMKFGFPKRSVNDFRYKKSMGGGALFDACGYPVKLATLLLGNECDVVCANTNMIDGYEVDMYGTATLMNPEGITAQIAFGMDNEYRCELEIWGSEGIFRTNRIFTAPNELMTKGSIIHQGEEKQIELGVDDAFANSIQHFSECIYNQSNRAESYKEIAKQAQLIEKIGNMAGCFNSDGSDK